MVLVTGMAVCGDTQRRLKLFRDDHKWYCNMIYHSLLCWLIFRRRT